MKKLMFMFALVIGIIITGCGSGKKVMQTTQQQPEPKPAVQIPPTRWMQNTYSAVSTTDPITFYNEYEINIVTKIPKRILMFQDGVTYYIDSSTLVKLTIPKLTPGVLVSTKIEFNLLKIMEISFDESNPNYNINFYVQSDKSFAQTGVCQIVYEGRKYPAEVITITPFVVPDKKIILNHLLSNFESLNKTNKIENSAGGRNAIGTKIIEQN